jgi:type IV fimbrial biogenesis protein FimT
MDERRPWRRARSGYTVVELIVVLMLIAATSAVALPHFSFLVDRWRVHQAIIHLQNAIRFANAQAVRTRSRVVIRAKSAICRSLQDAKNWSCGLTVFPDDNRNNAQDTAEFPLKEIQEFRTLTVMHFGGSNAYVAYGPHGAPIANPGRFEVYPVARPDSPAAQTICLSFGGRMRVKAGLGC